MDIIQAVLQRASSIQFINGPSSNKPSKKPEKSFSDKMKEKRDKQEEIKNLDKRKREIVDEMRGKMSEQKTASINENQLVSVIKKLKADSSINSRKVVQMVKDLEKNQEDEVTDFIMSGKSTVTTSGTPVDPVTMVGILLASAGRTKYNKSDALTLADKPVVTMGPKVKDALDKTFRNLYGVAVTARVQRISEELDIIATEIEPYRPDVALALDKLNDAMVGGLGN